MLLNLVVEIVNINTNYTSHSALQLLACFSLASCLLLACFSRGTGPASNNQHGRLQLLRNNFEIPQELKEKHIEDIVHLYYIIPDFNEVRRVHIVLPCPSVKNYAIQQIFISELII